MSQVTTMEEGKFYAARNKNNFDKAAMEAQQLKPTTKNPELISSVAMTQFQCLKATDDTLLLQRIDFQPNDVLMTQDFLVKRDLFMEQHEVYELPDDKASKKTTIPVDNQGGNQKPKVVPISG